MKAGLKCLSFYKGMNSTILSTSMNSLSSWGLLTTVFPQPQACLKDFQVVLQGLGEDGSFSLFYLCLRPGSGGVRGSDELLRIHTTSQGNDPSKVGF